MRTLHDQSCTGYTARDIVDQQHDALSGSSILPRLRRDKRGDRQCCFDNGAENNDTGFFSCMALLLMTPLYFGCICRTLVFDDATTNSRLVALRHGGGAGGECGRDRRPHLHHDDWKTSPQGRASFAKDDRSQSSVRDGAGSRLAAGPTLVLTSLQQVGGCPHLSTRGVRRRTQGPHSTGDSQREPAAALRQPPPSVTLHARMHFGCWSSLGLFLAACATAVLCNGTATTQRKGLGCSEPWIVLATIIRLQRHRHRPCRLTRPANIGWASFVTFLLAVFILTAYVGCRLDPPLNALDSSAR